MFIFIPSIIYRLFDVAKLTISFGFSKSKPQKL